MGTIKITITQTNENCVLNAYEKDLLKIEYPGSEPYYMDAAV
ncbi:MAG: hypothetical protein SGJ15_08800 [Bacteroidota bacterium]|nr:hypothetical protein [Bacteroidota bacterium]